MIVIRFDRFGGPEVLEPAELRKRGRGPPPDGRRVLAHVSRGYAEQIPASETALVDIPGDLPAAHSLALPTQCLTACHLLRTAARLAPGESVVVTLPS